MSEEFRETSRKETQAQLHTELEKLLATAPDAEKQLWSAEFSGYEGLFGRYLRLVRSTVDWSKIKLPPADAVKPYAELPTPDDGAIKSMLDKLVVVKLNGGLGTSMGCKGPKSLISVRNDLTFLDLTIQQIQRLNMKYDADVPLVLMNSFNTDDDTRKALIKYKNINVDVSCFNQSRYPRVNKETLMPIASTAGPKGDVEDWYPPGHGNFYEAFNNSGLLDKFIKAGKQYVFVSNIDNMGATVDVHILNFILSDEGKGGAQPGYIMEVTDKTRADVKGGTLITYEDKLRLLEAAQVPKDNMEEFKSVTKFRIFNTNNLWANLQQIKDNVAGGKLDMEIIVNPKNLDSGVNVLQLETAAGAAIKSFDAPRAINVPRSRFLPVKKSQDLLLLMSNLYEIEYGTLVLSKERQFPTTPLVKLGTTFDKVNSFLGRFAGIPDLLELDHLTVSGDVTFGSKVTLKGTVIIIAHHGERIDIPNGSILENKIVSGNLRILDH